MFPLPLDSIPNRPLILDSKNNTSPNTSTTTTPTQSRINPQLPSPPESTFELPAKLESPHPMPSSSGPSTPQRGRPESRYLTSLGQGRVPLHRRGTSRTYERLEDLLREAGYKETRVFTPETERAEVEAEERKERELRRAKSGSVRGSVGAVVGFLAGLLTRSPSLARDANTVPSSNILSGSRTSPSAQQEYSPPLSPLAHKQQLNTNRSPVSSHSHSPTFTSSVESLKPSPRGSSSTLNVSYRVTSHDLNTDLTPRPTPTLSRPLRPQLSFSSNQVPQTYTQASKARAYLRHMASAPSIQPSTKSTRPPPLRHSSTKYAVGRRDGYARKTMVLNDSDADGEDEFIRRSSNSEDQDESEVYGRPPLPRTWLENVARAVLLGGTGAHIGLPSHSLPQSPRPNLRISPSFSVESALSDQTNALVSKSRAPPFLCAQVATKRTPSETRVSRTRVVCRSAPASRSGSRVRVDVDVMSWVDRPTERAVGAMKGKEKHKARKAGKQKGKVKDDVPSLARTQVQGDGWANVRGGDMSTCSSEDDEDEGELDLARLLIPAKRQNSIQSLRRHLHGSLPPQFVQSKTPSPYSSPRNKTRSAAEIVRGRGRGSSRREAWDQEYQHDEDGDEHWRRVMMERSSSRIKPWKGKRNEREMFGGVSSGEDRAVSGAGSKRRRGIPGAWASGS